MFLFDLGDRKHGPCADLTPSGLLCPPVSALVGGQAAAFTSTIHWQADQLPPPTDLVIALQRLLI